MIKLYLFLIAIIIVVIVKYYQFKRKQNRSRNDLVNHIENSIAMRVAPEDLIIKSTNYQEENILPATQISMIDSIYDTKRNTYKVENNVSVLIYENNSEGKTRKYVSPYIELDEVTLRYKLLHVKEFIIYIDKNNADKYFFDIGPLS